MSAPQNITLGEYIYSTIDNNEYLQEIYKGILNNYSIKLFNSSDAKKVSINVDHALRFADILSKSANNPNAEKHKTWAQEIVALLNAIYPNTAKIKAYATSILANIGNYRGLQLISTKYKSTSFFDELYSKFDMEYLSIPYQENKYFFHSQKEIYNHLDDQSFSYSGPTSMGKSLLMRMFIKDKILNGFEGNFAILVPTKALITEITTSICTDLKEDLAKYKYKVVNSGNSLFLKQDGYRYIFVLTPERLLYTLISFPDISIDYLFIDEAHKISEKDGRSAFYYKVADMLSERAVKPHVIFASPNIPNPGKYLKILPYSNDEHHGFLATSFSPVSQMKYLIDLVSNDISIYNGHSDEFQHLFSIKLHPIEPFDMVSAIIKQDPKKQNIVYCGGKDKTIDMAIAYARSLPPLNNPKLNELSKEIKNEIHNNYYLAELIRRGVAYHIGYLPLYIRTTIEKLYRERLITTLFCTSTLIEGVNLPADNLFVLSYRNGQSNMSPVEFKNLLGRVGRIEYNLYGNVFIIRNKTISEKNAKELIRNDVPDQELSIKKVLDDSTKEYIINCLSEGNLEFEQFASEPETYSLIRKTGLMLLRDITKGKSSVIKTEFDGLLKDNHIQAIKDHFVKPDEKAPKPDDDINVSLDQNINLRNAISRGLTYPTIVNGMFDHNDIVTFLNKLHSVFKWDVYEKETLGNKEKLKWYAVILSQWMEGMGLS